MKSRTARFAALAAGCVVLSACAGDDPATGASGTPVPASTTGAATTPPTTAPPSSDPDDSATASTTTAAPAPEPVLWELTSEVDPADLRFETFAAMGGLRIGADPDARLIATGDVVGVDPERRGSKYWNAPVTVALVTQTANGEPIDTIEQFLQAARGVEASSVTPVDQVIEAFGTRLEGYRFSQSTQGGPITPMFATVRVGAPILGAWWPYPFGELYLAETGDGVLAVGMIGRDAAAIEQERQTFADVVLNLEILAGVDDGSADMPSLQVDDTEPRTEPATATGDEPVLDQTYLPIRPDTYQVLNLGERYTIELPAGWAAKPNVPGFVVLAKAHSFGPLNGQLTGYRNIEMGHFATTAPAALGEPIDLSDIDSFVQSPPEPLVVDEVTTVQLGDREALRFDIGFDPAVDCSDAMPCAFAFSTGRGLVDQFRSGFDMRVWWVDLDDGESIAFVTSATDAEELDEIQLVVETIRFG